MKGDRAYGHDLERHLNLEIQSPTPIITRYDLRVEECLTQIMCRESNDVLEDDRESRKREVEVDELRSAIPRKCSCRLLAIGTRVQLIIKQLIEKNCTKGMIGMNGQMRK